MSWQLIAHPEEGVCEVVGMSMLKALRQLKVRASIDTVQNIRDADGSVAANGEGDLDLVVISSTMPADDATSVGSAGREPTKRFIKELKRRRAGLPLIVVANTPDDRLAEFLDAFDRTGLVMMSNDLAPTLIERIKSLCSVERPTPGPEHKRAPTKAAGEEARVQLDIHLGGDQFGFWQLRRMGHGECEASGMLQLDSDLLRKVIRHSKRLNDMVAVDGAEWLEDLDELSGDLRMLLFRNGSKNMDCWDRFLTQREQVGGVSRSRIRITVNDETHQMLVEALRDSGHGFSESWVLNAPVFRRYATQLAFPPLFCDAASRAGPINCLIIEADEVPGSIEFDNGKEESFVRLRHLKEEAAVLNAILRHAAGGVVEHLSMAATAGKLAEVVLAKLGERHWHVVHFCGHVGGDGSGAALVLRAASDGLLHVKKLSKALNRTQLLFLNSCRSAATRIVMHAVEQSVSAVVGFQWVIEDRAALEFATDFYRLLFDVSNPNSRDLEQALLYARKSAYKRQPEHPSWMAPVLVMQMS